MTQYAELYFADKEEDIPVNKYLMKLPQRLRDSIIKWKVALKSEEKTTWGIRGEQIQMPMTYSMYRKMPQVTRSGLFEKIETQLEQRDISHVTLPKLIGDSPFESIERCTGNDIKAFFILDVIRFVAKRRVVDKNLQDLEVIILDGNDKTVDMIIDFIYPHINHLTVISDTPERFEEKAEDIFNDMGLNMRILSYTKGAISQGDVIIDTHYDDPLMIRFCKKGALYLDIANNPAKTVKLIEKQNDVSVKHQFLLSKDGQVVSLKKGEMLMAIDRVFSMDYKQTMKRLKKQNIEIYKLL